MSDLFRGIKNASYLAVGNLTSKIIVFVGFIFIARLLGPEDYGIYVTVGAFVGFFQIFLVLGLSRVIVREGSKNVDAADRIFQRTIGLRNLMVLGAVASCIVVSLFMPYEAQTKLYIVLFSSQLAYMGIKSFLGTVYQIREKMQYMALFEILNKFLFVTVSIAFLYMGFGLLSLFIIAFCSYALTLYLNYRHSQNMIQFDFFAKPQFNQDIMKPAFIFSLLAFLNFLITRVDLLMISFLGTSADVGIYGVAYKVAHQGVMLRNVTALAFFPIFVKIFHNGTLKGRRIIAYSAAFLVVMVLGCTGVSFFVRDIISFLFGSEYIQSGAILSVLIFYLGFVWAALPFTLSLQATHNEKFFLLPHSIMAVLNIALNAVLFLRFGLMGIAYSTIIVSVIGCLVINVFGYLKMKKQGFIQ
ncbi:MAG: oligosaccharide flippase family protein [Candidatus Aminicenantes bacterium]|nr:oligosaccharide flippase family protein [Candidatus Aminicenantes bacterium]